MVSARSSIRSPSRSRRDVRYRHRSDEDWKPARLTRQSASAGTHAACSTSPARDTKQNTTVASNLTLPCNVYSLGETRKVYYAKSSRTNVRNLRRMKKFACFTVRLRKSCKLKSFDNIADTKSSNLRRGIDYAVTLGILANIL